MIVSSGYVPAATNAAAALATCEVRRQRLIAAVAGLVQPTIAVTRTHVCHCTHTHAVHWVTQTTP